MKKISIILLVLLVFFNLNVSFLNESYQIHKNELVAEAAILIDANTGQILFEKNAHRQMYPASTTKLLTAIIIVENHALDEKVTIDAESPYTDGSRIFIEEGEVFTVEQLLNALLIESANDVAVALATYHSGSVEAFAEVMNKRAKELGAINSNFVNPNGLPHDKHVSTAYDLAQIGKKAYTMSTIREIAKKARYQINPTNKVDETRYLTNSNKFLYGQGGAYKIPYRGKSVDIKYDYINGLKTGYTVKAQQCFIGSANKDDKDLISVILSTQGSNIYTDTRKLIDYGFYEYEEVVFHDKNEIVKEITLNNFKNSKVDLYAEDEIFVTLPKGYDESDLRTEFELADIQLPIETNDKLGEFYVFYDDQLLNSFNLVSQSSVNNDILLTEETTIIDSSGFSVMDGFKILTKFLLAFLIWRAIITFARLKFNL